MNISKIVVFITVITIIIIIALPTFYKVVQINHHNLTYVTEKEIIEQAEKCFYDHKCENSKITLQMLYDLDYLDEMTEPITKEIYNSLSYVQITEKDSTFFPVK